MANTKRLLNGGLLVATLGIAGVAQAQFTSTNVSLLSHLNLTELGGLGAGNDCWGYTSPSGREYALMSVRQALVVIEVTTPGTPNIIATIPHGDCLWGDVKVYENFCYLVTDCGSTGLQVINLANVDAGSAQLVQTMALATQSVHDIAIDTDSGFAYLCGGGNGGALIAYSLANPAAPALVGQDNSPAAAYVHDAEIVTFTSGPNAGKQIAYCASGGTGFDIVDVTNKANIFRVSRTTYPNLSYAHQIWLSPDGVYGYLNDETDGVNETHIFDVSDINAPLHVTSYNSGINATDHNLYLENGFIFEAEYHGGLRIFCATDPINPVQVGWFDTYPEDDDAGFDGAWSVYPFFASGNVIVSDITRGFFVLDPTAALNAGSLTFIFDPLPPLVDPSGGTTIALTATGNCGAQVDPTTGLLFWREDLGDFQSLPIADMGGGAFLATFPPTTCGATVDYYVSIQDTGGSTFTSPSNAPTGTHSALSATGLNTTFSDDFETSLGWTATNLGATAGDWQQGVPIDDPNWAYDPAADGDGSGRCWLTENMNNPAYPEPWNTDVDGGAVELLSPTLDLTGGVVTIDYDYYLRLTDPNSTDALLVEISSNGAIGPWTVIADHRTDANWGHNVVTQGDLDALGVTLNANMRVRFTANDADPQSINEAGVDGFTLSQIICDGGNTCPWDCATSVGQPDGLVNIVDLLALLAAWGGPSNCDLDGSGSINIVDLLELLANWGPCP